jgi:ribosome-associated translation inhibitor RaiA
MDIPLQVTFRDFPQSPALQDRIREKATKLHALHPRITTCRVTVERRCRNPQPGRQFSVRIDVHMADREILVSQDDAEDVHVALRQAFDGAHRQLKHNEVRSEQ